MRVSARKSRFAREYPHPNKTRPLPSSEEGAFMGFGF